MYRTLYTAVFALAVVLGLGACTSWISESDQFQVFAKEVYFGGPNDKHIETKRVLVRWNRPLRVSLEGLDADRYGDRVKSHLADFARLSGLEAELVEAREDANLTIVLSNDGTFNVNNRMTTCFANIKNKDGDIRRVKIRIAVTEPAKVENCIAHELYHAFGLRFHSSAAASVLSSIHGAARPTEADDLALSMLYDSRLPQGAELHEAAAVLQEMSAQVRGDFGQHWAAVLPSASRIQVPHDAVRDYVSLYLRTRYPVKNMSQEIATWSGPAMLPPVAAVTLLTADRGYFIDGVPSFQRHMEQMVIFNKDPIEFGERNKRKGRYGLVDTIDLQIDDSECLGFRQRLGHTPRTGQNTDFLLGFLCADPGVSLDLKFVDDLMQNVRIQGIR